jgi:hypothetical protein
MAQPCTPARRSLADLRQAFRVLPPSLIIIYFLNACTEAMPMAAYTSLLNSDLGLLPDQVVLYYTVTFLPWTLKPFYAWISERMPIRGRRRRPYVVVCSVGTSACLLATALVVESAFSAFALGAAIAAFSAFSELMVGAALVDVAARAGGGGKNAVDAQAMATGVRSMGTLACLALSLPVICSGWSPSARQIIASTAVFPLLSAAAALRMPDPMVKRGTISSGPAERAAPLLPTLGSEGRAAADRGAISRIVSVVALALQLVVLGACLQSFSSPRMFPRARMRPQTWRITFVALSSVAAALLIAAVLWTLRLRRHGWGHRDPRGASAGRVEDVDLLVAAEDLGSGRCAPETKPGPSSAGPSSAGPSSAGPSSAGPSPTPLLAQDRDRPAGADVPPRVPADGDDVLWPAAALFLLGATPSASDTVYSFCTTALRMGPCALHRVNMAAALGAVLGSAAFAGPLRPRAADTGRGGLLKLLLATSLIASLARLLYLPAVAAGSNRLGGWLQPWLVCTSLVNAVAAQLALVPSVALATASAAPAASAAGGRRGETARGSVAAEAALPAVRYAVFLSSMEIGTTVSGWGTAPIVRSLGIVSFPTPGRPADWTGLPTLLLIDVCSTAGVVAIIALSSFWVAHGRKR